MVTRGSSSSGGATTSEMLLGHGMRTPPRDLRVLNEVGTSAGGTSGRIMLTRKKQPPSLLGCPTGVC
jgi:hypothetical protein